MSKQHRNSASHLASFRQTIPLLYETNVILIDNLFFDSANLIGKDEGATSPSFLIAFASLDFISNLLHPSSTHITDAFQSPQQT